MPQTETAPVALPHAAFLQRLVGDASHGPEIRLGQAAFLVMRLVDVLAPDGKPVQADAFRYQLTATDRYCVELAAEGVEAAHLQGIVRTVAEAHRVGDLQLLAPGLLAYAHYLEDEGNYEEALDVLAALLYVTGPELRAPDRVAAVLRTARVNRKLARFDEAQAAYGQAAALAEAAGDAYSVFISRHGRANVLHGRGNLPEAEQCYRALLGDAVRAGHQQAQALAGHGVAVVLHARGQPAEAVPHAWRAFELYEDEPSKLRALNDVGVMLLALGDAEGAERALLEVVRRGGGGDDQVSNAKIEVMHCASYRRDRLGFERWRAECEARADHMPPNILTDLRLKLAIGHARFGNFRKARAAMDQALALAAANGLHEFEFRIERIRAGFDDCEKEATNPLPAADEPAAWSEALTEVTASLAKLGA